MTSCIVSIHLRVCLSDGSGGYNCDLPFDKDFIAWGVNTLKEFSGLSVSTETGNITTDVNALGLSSGLTNGLNRELDNANTSFAAGNKD